MNRIIGYVLVRETNVGIPRLVVAAFDSGDAPEVIRKQAPTAEVMRHLGRRISSVLTDERGRFELSTDDLAFTGNEPRPNLVVAVFEPEDILDPAHPYPKAPEKRVLYMSVMPRVDAGAQEAFMIRLARAIVAELQLDTTEYRAIHVLEEEWKRRDAIDASVLVRQQLELRRRASAREKARERVVNLNAVPIALRGASNLVIGKASLSKSVGKGEERRTKIEDLQFETVSKGLDRLAEKAKPKMRLYLKEKDLDDLGLKVGKDGKVSGEPSYDDVAEKMLQLTGGTDLVRVRGASNPSPEVLEAKYLTQAPPKAPAPSGRKPKGAAPSGGKRKLPSRTNPSGKGGR